MIDYFMKHAFNPLSEVKAKLCSDQPLWRYVQMAIQDIEVINMLKLYSIDDDENAISVKPFIYVGNWNWDPHPPISKIKFRRRETKDSVQTKNISNSRLGILSFDIKFGARDKNKNLETDCIHNQIYIPIEDERGRFFLDSVRYSEYQLVDKLLYEKGGAYVLKSLLPIEIRYEEVAEISTTGVFYTMEIGNVKIFNNMEPVLSCFMHIPLPLCYLGVFPLVQFCDHISDDSEWYEYFKPLEDRDIYVKGYRKALDKFKYVRSILAMACHILRVHEPKDINETNDPKWWIYKLSYNSNTIEHKGACYEMYVARMLDTISAQVMPIPEIDKRNMVTLLRYFLQTDFSNLDTLSYDNKRLRLNEAISTIVSTNVSAKLKTMFKYGALITVDKMREVLKFNQELILANIWSTGLINSIDFTNDLDFFKRLKYTKNGPNSLGRLDSRKIGFSHKQLHPSMIGKVDLLEFSKDVGQTGAISPWADLSDFYKVYTNQFPNIKYELFDFIRQEFPDPMMSFDCDNIDDYNKILDKLTECAYINIEHYIETPNSNGGDEDEN